MKKYLVNMRLRVNGDVHKAGDTVELSDNQATPLLNMKAVTLAPIIAPVVVTSPVTAATPAIEAATPVIAPVTTSVSTVEPIPSEPIPNVTPIAPVETVKTTENTESVVTPTEAKTSMANAYSSFTKAQLKAELDKRGIAHDSKATNDVLEGLLVANDNKAQ